MLYAHFDCMLLIIIITIIIIAIITIAIITIAMITIAIITIAIITISSQCSDEQVRCHLLDSNQARDRNICHASKVGCLPLDFGGFVHTTPFAYPILLRQNTNHNPKPRGSCKEFEPQSRTNRK